MKSSGIGGQAVIEGIMMRNQDKYAIAVRKPDQQIEVVVKESHLMTEKHKWLNYPIIRGIFNFLDSLVTGVSTISYSASFYDDPAEQKNTKFDEVGKAVFKDKLESVLMAVTIVFSIAFALLLFMMLPYYLSRIFAKYIVSQFLLNFVEGVIKVVIFIIYILAISKMNDIKRTFMYHGAEHKCINCIENGAKLTPVNVKNSSRYHKRCGTSFLFFVVFLSVIFFIFIQVENTILQILIRLLLMPVIAGVSYEIIKWAGKSNHKLENIISKPGVWLQRLTTKEPDMDMIEVAIEAVKAVFDPDAFLEEYYKDSDNPEAEMEAKAAELALSSNLIIDEKKNTRSIHPDDIPEELKYTHQRIEDDSLAHIEFEDEIEMPDVLMSQESAGSEELHGSDETIKSELTNDSESKDVSDHTKSSQEAMDALDDTDGDTDAGEEADNEDSSDMGIEFESRESLEESVSETEKDTKNSVDDTNEDADAEDADAEDADAEDADAEDIDAEDADAEDIDAEDVDSEDADAENTNSGSDDGDDDDEDDFQIESIEDETFEEEISSDDVQLFKQKETDN